MPAPPRTSVSGVSADNIIEGSRKRAKLDPDASSSQTNSPVSSTSRLPDPSGSSSDAVAEEATVLGFKLLDVLINRIDEDDTPLTIPFLSLPSRADYPDYYNLIKNPVSLEQIRRRLQNREYASFEQVRNAMETLCRNAKRYNQKGSEIYEKARMMHQIILHVYIDLVEKGEVQPVGEIVLRSDPPLQQQSARLAKMEKPSRRARLDYDELEGADVAGRVTLRLKNDDDIDYEEDEEDEEGGEYKKGVTSEGQGDVSMTEAEEETRPPTVKETSTKPESAINGTAKEERGTPQMEMSADADDAEDDGDDSMAPSGLDDETMDESQMDRSMLTLAGKFDRRKRPGPRGKRLKSTLRHLVAELKTVLGRTGQPISRFFAALPSRSQYPDYYKVIQRPVALDSIEHMVQKKEYVNPHALVSDLREMVENAQYYNEEGSEVWEAAEELRQYVEGTTIPTLLADGFTLDPDDMRQSALPVDIAANSTVPAQAAAYRIQMERRRAIENGVSTEVMESVSPDLPARSLATTGGDTKFKVRLHSRGGTSSSPAPLGDMQPPVPAPPGASLGLSIGAPRDNGAAPGQRVPMRGPSFHAGGHSASPAGALPATVALPPYANPPVNASGIPVAQHPSQIGSIPPWTASPAANGPMIPMQPSPLSHSANGYFAPYPPSATASQSLMNSRSTMAPMAPPQAMGGYPNGSLPFQRPTPMQTQGNVQAPAGIATSMPGLAGPPSQQSSQVLSKRLPGEAPTFDPFQTNSLQVDSETTITRHPVITRFKVRLHSGEGDQLIRTLRNDVTRIHSISLPSQQSAKPLILTVEMTPRAVLAKEGPNEETENRRWTVSVHHNGKGVRTQWEEGEKGGVPATVDEAGNAKAGAGAVEEPTALTTSASSNARLPSSAPSTRVQVPAGAPCRFTFSPHPGTNIVSIHIYPAPPNSALQEISRDDKHPLRAKAKALLDLPERYRLLVYCRP